MNKNFTEDELESMTDLITDYISERECHEDFLGNNYNCKECENIDDCHMIANSRCNNEWAESIDYGGCDTEEEFGEQLFD